MLLTEIDHIAIAVKDLEAAMAKLSVQERKIGITSEPRFMADYAAAAKDNIDELEQAANLISEGDLMGTLLWKTQDWSLLPLQVANTVTIAKTVSGPAPFQIFPQFLGKNSKRMKQGRWMHTLARKMHTNAMIMRLDYTEPLQRAL